MGAKIAKNEAPLKGPRGLLRRLRAEGAQGHPQTPKMDAQRPPQDPKMEVQGYPKTLKMLPNATPRTSTTTPNVTNPTAKSGNVNSVSKFETNEPRSPECKQPLAAVWAGGVTPWREAFQVTKLPSYRFTNRQSYCRIVNDPMLRSPV